MDDEDNIEERRMRTIFSQLRFSTDEDTSPSTASSSPFPANNAANEAYHSSWVNLYRKYRRPMAPSAWKWESNSRPGKHCDSHLLDYFECIDRTKSSLAPGDPPEMYCLAARDLTTACMVSTLCEPKVFQVAKWCQENADPNSRSAECWTKMWEAQTCVRQSQILLGKTYWASSPELMSSTERYMILLGAPTCPGKKSLSRDELEKRKQFLEESLNPRKPTKEGDQPYIGRFRRG